MMKFKAAMKASWNSGVKSYKTTTYGFIAGLAIVLMQVSFILDADPETNLDFARIIEALALMGIGWFAKDGDKSTEDHRVS